MVLWMAPTFLWNGSARPEDDAAIDEDVLRRRDGTDDVGFQIESKWGKIANRLVENEASVVEVYNQLMCANCIARLFVIFMLGVRGVRQLT